MLRAMTYMMHLALLSRLLGPLSLLVQLNRIEFSNLSHSCFNPYKPMALHEPYLHTSAVRN